MLLDQKIIDIERCIGYMMDLIDKKLFIWKGEDGEESPK